MRPVEYTEDAIINAGHELQAIDRNITGFALRQKVGGGNPTRLKQVWDDYQSSQVKSQALPVADLPVEVAETVAAVSKALIERLASLAVELNDKAVKAAERRVLSVTRSAGEQQSQAERELADAAEMVDELESKLDALQSDAKRVEAKQATGDAAAQALAIELAQVRQKLTVNEQTANAMVEQHAAALDRMNASIETERTHSSAEVAQVRIELERAGLRASAEIEAAQAATEAARMESNAAREHGAKLSGMLEAKQLQITDLMRVIAERQPVTTKAK
jgi:colicin import membrane protein